MNRCTVLPLDPSKRRRIQKDEPPAYSAMVADGVMVLPVERRDADIHGSDEIEERRQQRRARR